MHSRTDGATYLLQQTITNLKEQELQRRQNQESFHSMKLVMFKFSMFKTAKAVEIYWVQSKFKSCFISRCLLYVRLAHGMPHYCRDPINDATKGNGPERRPSTKGMLLYAPYTVLAYVEGSRHFFLIGISEFQSEKKHTTSTLLFISSISNKINGFSGRKKAIRKVKKIYFQSETWSDFHGFLKSIQLIC